MLDKLLKKEVITPVILILVIFIIYRILVRIIKKRIKTKSKKTETIKVLFINMLKTFFIIIVAIIILDAFGINIKTILASLGVFAAVMALAMQDLLKDFISGISIVLEGQFSIGDIISVGDFKGEVVYLSLKTTKIKSYTGEIKIIANHNIENVINYSMTESLAIVDVCVSYNEDLDKVEKVLTEICKKLNKEIEDLKGEFEVLGVQELGDSSIKYRLTCLTVPCKHLNVQRKAYKIIKQEFDKKNIEIPFPQMVIHNG